MRIDKLPLIAFALIVVSIPAFGQGSVVINDPVSESAKMDAAVTGSTKTGLLPSEQDLMDKVVLPVVRKKLKSDICEETFELAGRIQGAFTRPGSKQMLIFYQFCQTGNGLGSAGVAIFDAGKVVGNFVAADAGWSVDAAALPDINQNGLNEFALYYSGGMHQGNGGTGVDIFEVADGALKGIGWFQADSFTEKGPVVGYRVTANPGKIPAFFKEKYTQNSESKWRKTAAAVPLKLTKVIGEFETLN